MNTLNYLHQHPSQFTISHPNEPLPSNEGWNFPVDNSAFGVNMVTHHINGTDIPAPVALFYPSTGYQHPNGGPDGYSTDISTQKADLTSTIPTPNWFYYYDKAWKNPWGFQANYWFSASDGSYSDPVTHRIFVGNHAHSLDSNYRPTYLYAKTSAAPNATSQLVGIEDVRGLDTYARILTHEGCHILMAIAIKDNTYDAAGNLIDTDGNSFPDVDNDNDRCPDILEADAGLRIGPKNTNNWDPTTYNDYGDGESLATLYERSVTASSPDDWADDGFNHGNHSRDIISLPINQSGVAQTVLYTAPSRTHRIARVLIYTGPYENIMWPSISRDPLNQLLPPNLRTP